MSYGSENLFTRVKDFIIKNYIPHESSLFKTDDIYNYINQAYAKLHFWLFVFLQIDLHNTLTDDLISSSQNN